MEDFQLDIVVGKGPAASLDPPRRCRRFTLVGATTRTGLITGPLRDRFGLVARLDYYDADELEAIVARAAGILGVPIDADGRARRSPAAPAGTPRIANRLLRRVRDFAEVRGDGTIDAATAPRRPRRCSASTSSASTRSTGPSSRALCEQFGGGPVGLSTLAISVGEEPETVEDVYEPFLIQQGLLQRTPRGGSRSPAAYDHLGLRRSGRRARRRPVRQLTGRSDRQVCREEVGRAAPTRPWPPSRSQNIGASWLSKAWPALAACAPATSSRFVERRA